MSKVGNASSKGSRYLSTSCIEAIKVKHRKWKKYKYCKTDQNFEIYKVARNRVTTELKKSKYYFEKDLAARIKTENKLFWGYVRAKTQTKTIVGNLIQENGELTTGDQETANLLNDYFASVFEIEGDDPIPAFDDQPLQALM